MTLVVREFLVVSAIANLLLVAKGRSVKTCCQKLDPDAFRNIVSTL